MGNKAEMAAEHSLLERILRMSWYVTVGSALFGSCLLRIKLPFGGHFFLFRGAVIFTCLIYLLVLLHRRENPFRGLSKIELCFVAAVACMIAYSVISAAWSLSLGAWFSRVFTMCQMFALVFLFLKLCRDESIMRITVLLIGIATLICILGGLVECFRGPFFDTPDNWPTYLFFERPMYAPIFTFYNTNGFTVSLLFTLELLYLYMAFHWEQNEPGFNRRFFYGLSAGITLMLFLCCAGGGRLAILSFTVILCGLSLWLAMRYKKGLTVFIAFVLCFAFVYVGENYAEIKYNVVRGWEQIAGPTNAPGVPGDVPNQPSTPEPPQKNFVGTLQTIVPAITRNYENEDVPQSDITRIALLKNSWKMLMESKGLGIGAGNAELRMAAFDNTDGKVNIHCFIMEVLLEFGIFALLPLLVLFFMIFTTLALRLYGAVKTRRWELFSDIIFLLFTIATFPLLSTANSSSWSLEAMWLYVALVLLYSGRMERLGGEGRMQ